MKTFFKTFTPILLYWMPLNNAWDGSAPITIDDTRIVGGVETSISSFPHQVSLQLEATHICGGAIIGARVVLTAAHCVTEHSKPQLYTVRAGSTEHRRGGVLVGVRRIIQHDNFNVPTSLNNDIAVLVLEQMLTFSRYLQPIRTALSEDWLPARAVLFVSGWGATSSEDQTMMPRLRYTVVQKIDDKNCSGAYEGAGSLSTNMMCAGTAQGGHDSCQGDSGGPLIGYTKGVLKLFGIVSWGIGCAHPNYPGVYTKVAEFGGWLNRTMARL